MAAGRPGSRRTMFVSIVKLIEVMARALFVVGVTYTLPLEAAGQFGIVVTLVGLFSFLIGWERHVDIQRRLVGEPDAEFDRAVSHALHLYMVNGIVLVPVLLVAVWWWAHLDGWLLLLTAIIVVADQLGNQIYQFALVSERFHKMLAITAMRNLALMLAVVAPLLLKGALPGIAYVLQSWAAVSLASLAAAGVAWLRIRSHPPDETSFRLGGHIWSQHRTSATHFFIGLVAIFALQFDRFVVGGLLEFREVGAYFRHLLVVSLVYQFFNIASYGRLVPMVFKMAKTGDNAGLNGLILRECIKVVGLVGLLVVVIEAGNRLTGHVYFDKYGLELPLIGTLLAAATIRIFADFNGMVLNSMNLERVMLLMQIIAFTVSALLGLWLTWRFHGYGAAYTMVFASALYFGLTLWAVRSSRRRKLA